MAKTTWPAETKTAALAAYREHGPAEAERLTGVPRKTIASWARRTQTQMDASVPDRLRVATEIASLTADKKRARIAELMLDRLAESLDRLGEDAAANAAESRLINVLVEKQALLTGGATSRVEHDLTDTEDRVATVRSLTEQLAKRTAASATEESA